MNERRIYLDNNASAPLLSRVMTALTEEMEQPPGNPSSIHLFGQQARQRMIKARDTIAQFLGVRSQEIIFHSGSTEGNNMVIDGLLQNETRGHVITSDVEHSSIIRPLQALEKQGVEVTSLKAGKWGVVKPEAIAAALRPDTRLIALAGINNETGVILDLEPIAALAHQSKIPLVVDAVAMIGKEPIIVYPGISAMTFSGHKFHAPKGVGFNVIRRSLKLNPLIRGGFHEYKRRAGTENLLGIIGMAEAIRVLEEEGAAMRQHMRALLSRFEQGVTSRIKGVRINGEGPRTVNTVNFSFPGVDGESLLTSLDLEGVSASHGSACSAGTMEPSRILINMGIPKNLAHASLRFSLSSMTTEDEIDTAIEIIAHVVERLQHITDVS